MTKNIWVSTGAHIVNDWLLFLVALLGSSLAVKV
jgi:membrane protease YdiL (CAAX protease family)